MEGGWHMNILVCGSVESARRSVEILQREGLAEACTVHRLDGSAIWDADALVIPWCTQIEGQEGWRELVREYVRSGGGLVLCHRGCGFYNEMDRSLFTQIASVVDSWNDRRLRVVRRHDALGWRPGRTLTHGYMDHLQLKAGRRGTVLLEDARGMAVVVVGVHGRGRVAFLGNGPELARPAPPAAEAKMLARLVRWAAGGTDKKPWQTVGGRIQGHVRSALLTQHDQARTRFDSSLKQLAAHKEQLEQRLKQFNEPRDEGEERIRDCVLVQADRILEHWRSFPPLDARKCPLDRGPAWTGWLSAMMHRVTGDDQWARIALHIMRPVEHGEGETRLLGPFGVYPYVWAYSLLKDVGVVVESADRRLRRYLAESADAMDAYGGTASLRGGHWHHNLSLMPSVGIARIALELPDHPKALHWFRAGTEVARRNMREKKIFEDSSGYSPLDLNYLDFFADDHLGKGWFKRRGVSRLHDDFAELISPPGWLIGYGDGGGINNIGDGFLAIIERAHKEYGRAHYRAVADRLLETVWRTDMRRRSQRRRTGMSDKDYASIQCSIGHHGWFMMHAWLAHEPGPARFRTRRTYECQNRVVVRTGWRPDDAFLMLGKRDGKWDHRGSWHGHEDALAICGLAAGGKVLLADSAYEHPQKDFHHTILIHPGEVDDPLRLPDCCDQDFSVYQEAEVKRRTDGVEMVIENYDNTGVKVARSVRLGRAGARITDRLVASRSGIYTIAQAFFAPEVEELGAGRYRLNRPTCAGEEQPPSPALTIAFAGPSTHYLARDIQTSGPQCQVARVLVTRLQEGKPLTLPVLMDFQE